MADHRLNQINVSWIGMLGYVGPVQVVYAGDGAVNLINATTGNMYLADFPAFNGSDTLGPSAGVILLASMTSISFDGTFDVWAGQLTSEFGFTILTKVGGSTAASAI